VANQFTTEQNDAYARIHASDDFAFLRSKYRGFAFAATLGFMAWYLLYVFMSTFAGDVMTTKVIGNINVALIFGLLQFVSTFVLARMYATFAAKRLDPTAAKLRAEFDREARP
jgi:uncharacterized membrane protein (DUF485 family)